MKTDNNSVSHDVDSLVPSSWKLCALVFKAIAEGHLQELESQVLPACEEDILNGSIQDETFSDAVLGLYIEACEDTRRELPTEILSREKPHEALEELRTVAQDIIVWYNKAISFIDETSDYAECFETIADNCIIITELLSEKPNIDNTWSDSKPAPSCFSHAEMRFWHKVIDGTCIEKIEYDDFYHILECSGEIAWFPKEGETETNEVKFIKVIIDEDGNEGTMAQKDYESLQLRPLAGYGMAMYAFELLLLVNRRRVLDEIPNYEVDDEGEEYISGFTTFDLNADWEDKFKKRIVWDDNYNVREDSWKTGYFSTNDPPSSYTSDVKQEDKDRINTICNRKTFEDVVGPAALEGIVAEQVSLNLGYDQYRFIHDNLDTIGQVYIILLQELEYLYDNIDDIIDCFEDKYRAERNHDEFSKLRYELKQSSNDAVNKLYARSLTDSDYSTIHRMLFSRRFYYYEYLWQQPLIVYSELIDQYLQKCIIQDEQLLLVIKRTIEDTPLKQSIEKEKAKASNKEIRKYNAKIAMGSLVDDDGNIVKQSDRIQVVRILIQKQEGERKEFARPRIGWPKFIEKQKHNAIPGKYEIKKDTFVPLIDDNNRFTDIFYDKIGEYARIFLNGIDWTLYDGVFKLDGKELSGEQLKSFIGSNRALYVDLIKDIIKKYEGDTNESFVRISR